MDNSVLIIGGIVLVGAVIGMVFLGAAADEAERKEWQAFVDANGCTVVEQKDAQSGSSVGPVIGMDGKLGFAIQTTTLAAQECWLCKNGQKYWKKAGLAEDRTKAVQP